MTKRLADLTPEEQESQRAEIRAYYEKNRQRIKVYQKEWASMPEHRERKRVAGREYMRRKRAAMTPEQKVIEREKKRLASNEYYRKNRVVVLERERQRMAERTAEEREAKRLYQLAWRRANPDKANAAQMRYEYGEWHEVARLLNELEKEIRHHEQGK